MQVHLVDGTYELFRFYYGAPEHTNAAGLEVGAVRGVVGSMLSLLTEGATHVAVATDHVIESFRNDLWPGYKDGSGIEPVLLAQFPVLEDALRALGVVVWAMEEFEADDALGAGAVMAATDERVEQIIICTPDKDLAQCVMDDHVIQYDRRKRETYNEEGIVKKFGVSPASIPDYLALVGDSSDGFPGLSGWGAKSASTLLARYRHIEQIPDSAADWDVQVRAAEKLAATLREQRELAGLFKHIATVAYRAPVSASVDELEWTGPTEEFSSICEQVLEEPAYVKRAEDLVERRS